MTSPRSKNLPPSVQRLAKMSSLSGLPTIHAEPDVLNDVTGILSPGFGASPDYISPNSDNTAYIVLFNKHIYFVQLQKKWELGSISDQPLLQTVPVVVYKETVANIASFVTSTIDDDFIFLVHKDERDAAKPRSLADVDYRWLRFQSSEHVEQFIAHCLSVCAPQLLSKARMIVFQSGGAGTNVSSLSTSDLAAETARIVSESERTLVVTDLVVRSVSDILTKVKFEVDQAVSKSKSFTARWGMKVNDAPGMMSTAAANHLHDGGGPGLNSDAPYGIAATEHDFMNVAANNSAVCARMKGSGEKKVLFSCEVFLTDHTHEMVIVTDTSLRIEKSRKDRLVHLIPFRGIEGLVLESNGPTTAAAAAASAAANSKSDVKLLLKLDFSVCTSIRGDVTLRFPCTAQGLRHKNLFVAALTSAYEKVVVGHLPVTESTDVFWARRGTLESQLVRLMKAIRPDGDSAEAAEQSAAAATMISGQLNNTTSATAQQHARLSLYLCVKQPQRLVYSLSASSAGVDKRLLAFLARAMHRIFLSHHEAVATRQREHHRLLREQKHKDDAQKKAASAATTKASRDEEEKAKMKNKKREDENGEEGEEDAFHRFGDLRCLGFMQPCVEYEVNAYRFHRARVDMMMQSAAGKNDDFFSRSTADAALLVPPPFGSSDSFASLALREYMGASGARFVSLCVGQPMEQFSTDPQTLKPMGLQAKQFWASHFLKQLRAVVLDDSDVDEVMPDSLKVILSLVWRSFEKDRQQSGADSSSPMGSAEAAASALAALRARRRSSVAALGGGGDDSSPGSPAPTHQHQTPNQQQQQQHPNSSSSLPLDEVGVMGGFLFSQFLRPSLVDPLGEGVITSDLSPVQKKNLEDVTCLLQCVLTQSDLPLAGCAHMSESERRYLRRFVDNEIVDASRVLRSLVYPDISADDPEGDDGSMIPDFFPPPVPGQIPFGSVTLLPHGDPRTVESFWQRYLLKMPIDLHSIKLLNAFNVALKQISLQTLTAAFVPSLHAVGFLGSGAVGVGTFSGVVGSDSVGFGFGPRSRSIGSQFRPTMEIGISAAPRAASAVAPSALSMTTSGVGATAAAAATSSYSSSYSGGGGGFGSASAGPSAAGGRMRSQTLVRAESQAYERFAAAEMTIHRLTYEVKQLKEQLAAAKEAELETRMAAARAMEHFSQSFALSMQRSAKEAVSNASFMSNRNNGTKTGGNHKSKGRARSPNSRRRRSNDKNNNASSSSGDDSSDVHDNDSEQDIQTDNGSFRINNNNNNHGGKPPSNPLAESEATVVQSILTPEARWRHSLEQLPAASRSGRGAGSEQVFGNPMDNNVLQFLAMPQAAREESAREYFRRVQGEAGSTSNPLLTHGANANSSSNVIVVSADSSRRSPVQPVPHHPRGEDINLNFAGFTFLSDAKR